MVEKTEGALGIVRVQAPMMLCSLNTYTECVYK